MNKEFVSISEIRSSLSDLPAANAAAAQAASDRNGVLTKPPGALGRLEDVSIWYASWRGTATPELSSPQVLVFAGNHGVAAKGVSAFPAEVTVQMVANFQAGGAAVNQLAKLAGAQFGVHAIDLDTPTADFTEAPAMDEAAFIAAFNLGFSSVDPSADLLVTGEMGIGNTTSAAAVLAANFGGNTDDWIGRGTGVDDDGLKRKSDVIKAGLALHKGASGLDALATLGGRELAAMAGAILAARHHGIPVILDGFICTAAASCLFVENESALEHCVAGHQSEESGHVKALAALKKQPLLQLGMRLGEGSGAALAIQVLKGALACHNGMATFAEAGVSEG